MELFMPVEALVILGLIFLFFIAFLRRAIYLVKQAEVIVVERLGKFDRLLEPGLHVVIPFISRPRQVAWSYVYLGDDRRYYRRIRVMERIDLRESVYDFPKQHVITKDNVMMEINALLYYQITDPKAAIYEIANLPEAIEKLTQTTLRNVIGAMELDESLVSRDSINEKLRIILDEATDKWGVKINRVELQEVNPPEDIRQAMEKQMRAERERRAVMLEAEGKKGAAILESEGIKESQVLRAQGEAEARTIRVEAEAKAISMIQNAVPNGDPLPYLIATAYIKALPELMNGKNDKLVVVPYEATALTGSLATIKKIFEEVK
jgi:regulator of protease activity HflC (stomatin/prohibitin superfamily)